MTRHICLNTSSTNGFVKISERGTYLHYMLKKLCINGKLLNKEDLALINKCLDNASNDTDFDIKDGVGMTVFHLCCKAFAISLEPADTLLNTLDKFLSHGCDINSCNDSGNTCMHMLITIPISCTLIKIIHFLLSKGADISLLNNKGESVLCLYHQFKDILNIAKSVQTIDLQLLKAGANPNQMSEAVKVPMEIFIGKIVHLSTVRPKFDLVSNGCPWPHTNSFHTFAPLDKILFMFLNHMRSGLNVKGIHPEELRKFVRWLWQKVDEINFIFKKSVQFLCQCLIELHHHGCSELVYSEKLISEKSDIILDKITERFVTLQELSVYVIRVNLRPNAFVGVRFLQVPSVIKEVIA